MSEYASVWNDPHENSGKPWTGDEEARLRKLWDRGSTIEGIARLLKRTPLAIECRVQHLSLERDGYHPERRTLPVPYMPKMDEAAEMHLALTLLQEGYTTVDITYAPDDLRKYTYKIKNEMADGLSPKDMVVVPARDKFVIGYVVEVHEAPQIDTTAPYDLRWVMDVVDRKAWDEQYERELRVLEELKKVKRLTAKEQARARLMAMMGGDAEKLAAILNSGS